MEGTVPTPGTETSTPQTLENNTNQPSAAPATANADESERLRKEAEQARMRANQLENELKQFRDEQEEAKRKQLEEKEEWKVIAEQEKQRREELESQRQAEETAKQLTEATDTIFSEYSSDVVEIAKETGLSLVSTDEDSQKALRAKLDKLSEKFQSTQTVTPNNPGAPSQPTDQQLLERMRNGDRTARTEVISNLESVKIMKAMAGYQDK